MVEIKTLFHRNDPETSEIAADRMVKSGALSRQEQEVLNAIKHHVSNTFYKDFTARELSHWGRRIDYYIIQRRLSGLRNKGRIERTGEKREGCCVWKISGALES